MSKKDLQAGLARRTEARRREHLEAPDTPVQTVAVPEDQIWHIDVGHIRPAAKEDQPRQRIDDEELRELADSIQRYGLIEPITVYPTEELHVYEIEAGERRWRAHQLLGFEKIRCVISESKDKRETYLRRVAENVHRSNLNAVEEAISYQKIIDTFEVPQTEAAELIGKPRSYLVQRLGILRIPQHILERASGLGVKALISISKGANEQEMEQLFERHLDPSTTTEQVDRKRSTKTQREHTTRMRRSFDLSIALGFGEPENFVSGAVTLNLVNPPKLTDDDLADIYIEAAKRLSKEGRQLKKKAVKA